MSAPKKSSNAANYFRFKAKFNADVTSNAGIEPITNFSCHGYAGFKLYFATDTDIKVQKTLENVRAFKEHVQRNQEVYSLRTIEDSWVFTVNYDVVQSDDKFLSDWSDFNVKIITDTAYCLSCMGLAIHQIVTETGKRQDVVPYLRARITDVKPLSQLKQVKVDTFGRLVTVRGTAMKASNVRLKCEAIAFSCGSCGGIQVLPQDGPYKCPSRCPVKGCKAQSNFEPLLTREHTKTVSWQTMKLQEVAGCDEPAEGGRVPRTIDCHLTNDLVSCCTPGKSFLPTIIGMNEIFLTC